MEIEIKRELVRLTDSIFFLSCFVFLELEIVIIYVSFRFFKYMLQKQIEDKGDNSKIAPSILTVIFFFITSFYIVMSFLSINNNYFFY